MQGEYFLQGLLAGRAATSQQAAAANPYHYGTDGFKYWLNGFFYGFKAPTQVAKVQPPTPEPLTSQP